MSSLFRLTLQCDEIQCSPRSPSGRGAPSILDPDLRCGGVGSASAHHLQSRGSSSRTAYRCSVEGGGEGGGGGGGRQEIDVDVEAEALVEPG